jgi:hypothetical protein
MTASKETLERTIARSRALHLSMMKETVQLRRPSTSAGTRNETTGDYTLAAPTTIYTGVGQIRAAGWIGQDQDVGDRELRLIRAQFRLPHTVDVRENDELEVLTSENDPLLVGQEYRITDVILDGWTVVRRGYIEELKLNP